MVAASDLRRALRSVAHRVKQLPSDWDRTPAREYLQTALEAGERSLLQPEGSADFLALAALRILLALELQERQRLAPVEDLRKQFEERRAR